VAEDTAGGNAPIEKLQNAIRFMPSVSLASQALLSYVPSRLSVQDHDGILHVFPATGLTLPLYFALKQKHDYQLENRDAFVSGIRKVVATLAAAHDCVVYPESRFPFLKDITTGLSNCVELRKRSKLEICQKALASAKWNREARRSQETSWTEMGESFTINKIKSNQRKHYVPYLFERASLPTTANVLLLDDFIMSGNTLAAMRAAVSIPDVTALGIFYQLDSAEQLRQVMLAHN
jgi:hypothetical protein